MKRVEIKILFILIFLFSICFVTGTADDSINNSLKAEASRLEESTNQLLSNSVDLNEGLKIPMRLLFGINPNETLTLQKFVIIIGLFIWTVFLVSKVLDVFGIFGKGFSLWLGSLIIVLLAANSGAFNLMYHFFFYDLITFIGWGFLHQWAAAGFLIFIIFFAALYYGAMRFLNILKESENKMEARNAGVRTGVNIP